MGKARNLCSTKNSHASSTVAVSGMAITRRIMISASSSSGCAVSSARVCCHRSIQNRPVVIESKPATFMVSKGFEVSWQVGSLSVGSFLRLIGMGARHERAAIKCKIQLLRLRGAFSRSRSKRNKWREARREVPFMPDLGLNWRMRSALGQ